MLRSSRPMVEFEKGFINSRECVEFAVEVSDRSVVPKIIDNIKKWLLPLKIKAENDHLFYHKELDVPVLPLPSNIVKTAQQAAEYVKNVSLRYEENGPLAIIAADDTKVAINATHLLVDGGFCLDLCQRLLNDNISESPGLIPKSTYELMEKELNKKENLETSSYFNEIRRMAGFKRPDNLNKDNSQNPMCKYHNFENRAEDFQFMKYKIKNNLKKSNFGLSESYWTMIPLVCMAIDKNLDVEKLCISTCVDLRRDLKEKNQKIDQTIGMHFIDINLIADSHKNIIIPRETTIFDLGQQLRKDLSTKLVDGSIYRAYNSMGQGAMGHTENVFKGEVSNVGWFDLKAPIVDCWVQQSMRSKYAEGWACVCAFSRMAHGQNTLVTRFQQPVTAMDDKLLNLYSKSLLYAMKEIPIDTSIQEAFDEIKHFQKNL